MNDPITSAGPLRRSIPRFRRPSLGDVDEWWTGYAAAIPGFAGSWLTFWYFSAVIWAIVSLALRRYPFVIPARAWPFALACWLFSAVMLLSAAINSGAAGVWVTVTKVVAVASAPLIIARFRFSDPARSLEALFKYAPLGGALGFAMGLAQVLGMQGPDAGIARGGAGNATVYGVAMAWMGLLSFANCQRGSWTARAAAMAGFLLSMAAVVLSQTRSLYPCALIIPLIYFWTHRPPLNRAAKLSFLALAALLAVSGFVLKERISESLSAAAADVQLLQEGSYNSSLGNRAALWTAALAAIAEKPALGHGEAGKMDAVIPHLPKQVSYLRYSHVHNALLDVAVSGGMLGAAAFLGLFITPFFLTGGMSSREDLNRNRYTVASTVAVFAMNGSVNSLFTHDLIGVLYLLPLILVASVGGDPEVTPLR